MTECPRITDAWKCAVFSDAHDQSLQRYFNIHLEDIRDLSDTLLMTSAESRNDQQSLLQVNVLLLSLIEQIQSAHHQYFDAHANTPLLWRRKISEKHMQCKLRLIKKLKSGSFNLALQKCVLNYLAEIDDLMAQDFCDFHALNYYVLLITNLDDKLTKASVDRDLEILLTNLNFNRMEYVIYHQSSIRNTLGSLITYEEKIQELQQQQISLFSYSVNRKNRCQHDYRSIDDMLDGWLSEQISFTERELARAASSPPSPGKLRMPLRLSVAQIAYVIRLLVDVELLNDIPLIDVFRFVCENFSSKKREAITLPNLSKEYYGITQFTAARVLAWFERITGRINRDFFPLLAAISLISFFS